MFNVYIYISVALILRLSSSKACYGVNKSFGRTILILSGKLGIVSLFYTINISISDKFKLAVIKIFMKFVFFVEGLYDKDYDENDLHDEGHNNKNDDNKLLEDRNHTDKDLYQTDHADKYHADKDL